MKSTKDTSKFILNHTNFPLYNQLPNLKIQLDKTLKICEQRLKLIDYYDQLSMQQSTGVKNQNLPKFKNEEYNLIELTSEDNISNDNLSFFLIACLFCKTEVERLWLANIETKIYEERLAKANVDTINLLSIMKIPIQFEKLMTNDTKFKLINFRSNFIVNEVKEVEVIKIPFEYVLNLVPSMEFHIQKGFVYITRAEASSIISNVFKEECIKRYTNINKSLERINSDNRIANLLKDLEREREENKIRNLKKDTLKNMDGKVSLEDIEYHAQNNYPLCMYVIHRNLTNESHLKHNGRLQYSLFLKGLGLSLNDSIKFWQNKFAAKTSLDKFNKDYAYGFRHSYGLEGKRSDYPPYSCTKILNLPLPNMQETHGCPFKTFSEDKLKSLLYELRLKELDVTKIMEKKKEPQIACIKFFEAKFPDTPFEKVGVHPNYYFESAFKSLKKKKMKNSISIEDN